MIEVVGHSIKGRQGRAVHLLRHGLQQLLQALGFVLDPGEDPLKDGGLDLVGLVGQQARGEVDPHHAPAAGHGLDLGVGHVALGPT